MNDNNNNLIFFGLLALIGVAIFFGTRSSGVQARAEQTTTIIPAGQTYHNTKTWDIKYNELGMISQITKHVDASVE